MEGQDQIGDLMASDGAPITLSVAQPAQAGSATSGTTAKPAAGKPLLNIAAATAASVVSKTAAKPAVSVSASASATKPTSPTSPATSSSSVTYAAPVAKTPAASQAVDPRALVTQLNKHLNDSGLPDQYRVDPHSSSTIQEINPANGAVIGEFSASEFPSLARTAGALGLLIDSQA
jgi:hypothetical protein